MTSASNCVGGQSPGMLLPPSPPVQRQNARGRRRKRFFDESIVLSNAEMRRRLEDTSKIVRKRQANPSTTLDVWKFQKRKKKDQMFNEPLFCGMCMKLRDVYERAFPTVMDASSPNTIHEMDVEMDQAKHSGMQDQDLIEADMEREQARYNVVQDQDLPEPMQSTFDREHTPIDAMTSIHPSMSKGIRIPEHEMPSSELLDDISEEPMAPEMRFSPEVSGLLNSPEEV
ncbi:hypothetical protein Taro_025472 [Colocasia esculenta]|uniref:Uncharacterized protein n=1 Tax=Colocasia esculenta TaxID=4460 RepID=A0A843VGM8_COLES|nr:hypothetical protein [Colocasia esculenta]